MSYHDDKNPDCLSNAPEFVNLDQHCVLCTCSPKPTIESLGIECGGRGAYYSKIVDGLSSCSIWMEGEERWTPEELEAIARHRRAIDTPPES